ncbi:MAG: hypothetical protein ACRDJH_05420 [Thermomicrobiales bacterium]
MSGRLLRIELRRNELLLIFPVVVVLYGFFTWDGVLRHSILFWADGSIESRNVIALLGPFSGAVAAWMAGRNRRRGLDELIATTPRPALGRDLTICAATAILGIAAYAAAAVAVLGWTAPRTSWDGPYVSVLIPSLVGIAAMAAVGYPIGRAFPRRITAILVGAGLIIAIALPITLSDSWPRFLSPVGELNASPWYGIRPGIAFEQSLFLLGIAYVGLAAVAAASKARRVALPVLVVAIVTSAIGIGAVRAGAQDEGKPKLLAYEPVCAGDPVTICVHPAFEGVLDELADRTNTMLAPFAGLDGVPTRFEQQAPTLEQVRRNDIPMPAEGEFYIEYPTFTGMIFEALFQISDSFLGEPDEPDELDSRDIPVSEARFLVHVTLLESAGYDLTCEDDQVTYEIDSGFLSSGSAMGFFGIPCEEVDRFTALDPEVRAEWLRQNAAALRAGEIDLEDLP